MNLTMRSALVWHKARCPICGEVYEHLAYKPITCGKVACVLEAWKRGLFDNRDTVPAPTRESLYEQGKKDGEKELLDRMSIERQAKP